jgi:hypothetical protein
MTREKIREIIGSVRFLMNCPSLTNFILQVSAFLMIESSPEAAMKSLKQKKYKKTMVSQYLRNELGMHRWNGSSSDSTFNRIACWPNNERRWLMA